MQNESSSLHLSPLPHPTLHNHSCLPPAYPLHCSSHLPLHGLPPAAMRSPKQGQRGGGMPIPCTRGVDEAERSSRRDPSASCSADCHLCGGEFLCHRARHLVVCVEESPSRAPKDTCSIGTLHISRGRMPSL
jgi:hypothetical protein